MIIQLYNEGNSLRQIEVIIQKKVCRSTIGNWIKKEGITLRKNTRNGLQEAKKKNKERVIKNCLDRWGFSDIEEMKHYFKTNNLLYMKKQSPYQSKIISEILN